MHGLRLNPGNIRRPEHIKAVAAEARDRGLPIRIGVNGGSLDPALYEKYGGVTPEAMVESALQEIAYFDEVGFDLIKISVKASSVPLMVEAYRQLSRGHRPPAAPRRHRGRPAAGRAGQGHGRHRHAAAGGHRRHDPLLAHRRSGRGGARRPPAARGARPARAQERRPHRLPVVRAGRDRRDRRRQPGDGGVRRSRDPAAGGGDGLRRQRPGRGARGRPRHRRRQQARPPVRQGPQRRRRARGRDGRGARRVGRVHQRARHRGRDRPRRHRRWPSARPPRTAPSCSTTRATTPTTPPRRSSRSARPCRGRRCHRCQEAPRIGVWHAESSAADPLENCVPDTGRCAKAWCQAPSTATSSVSRLGCQAPTGSIRWPSWHPM